MKKHLLILVLATGLGCLFSPSLQAQTTNIWNFNYSGSIVQWTVPSTGYYDVTAYGAQGGGFTFTAGRTQSFPGGRGAVIGGLFLFEQGEVLNILAGGAGSYSSGGGGSFVVNSSTNPLVVAGGGGGTAVMGGLWPGASITTSGNDATYVNQHGQNPTGGGSGGTNGTGGTIGTSVFLAGAGGGGFFGNGQSQYRVAPSWAASDMSAAGGTSYLDGGAGGSGGYFYQLNTLGLQHEWLGPYYAVDGGFGGGGQALKGGGGGGGYSGGGGGGADAFFGGSGGGGGSFLATSASNDVMRVWHTGNGRVSISAATVSLLVDENTTISSGTNDYYNIVLGGNVGDANTSVSVTNAGTVVNASNYVLVGQNGSSNTMTVSGGASVADQAFSVVGLNATASGNSLRVTGTGSTWSSGGLVVGDSGSGNSMAVEAGGGVVSAGSGVALGYNVGSSGNSLLVDGSGSTLTSVSDLIVGFGGSGNSVVVSNGGTLTNSHYTYGGVIGLNSGATNNSVLVTGTGSTWSNSGDLTIGDAGEGTLTIANGGSVSANAVIIASQAGSTGTLNFGSLGGSDTAGSLIGPGISFGSGSGTINFNQTDSLIGSGFSGNGSLNQLGSGTTILTGTNTYTGTTTVNRGTLVVEGQSSLGTSSVTVNGGTLAASGVFTDFPLALNAGNMTLTGAGSSWNTGTNPLSVGNSSQGASVVVAGGASVVSGGLLALGNNSGASNNSVSVTGSGSAWNSSGDLVVGMSGSGNRLVIEAGGQVTTTVASATVGVPAGGILGYNAGSSNNSVLVTGSGSSWNNSGVTSLTVGNGGSGNSLVVSNGGHVTAEYTYISRGAGAADNSVVVTGPGSTLSNTMNMLVGVSGSGGSLVVSDGATIRSFIGQLGYNAGSSNNSALVTGSGSVWNNPNSYYGIQVGVSGGATLTVANGGTVNLNGTTLGLTLAENAGSTGTLNIGRFGTNDAAGTVSTPKIGFGAGTGTINFNQSNSTTISAAISGAGSVNQLGSGTTTLTGNNTYTGPTTVEDGTLLVGGQISLSDVSVLNGAAIGGAGTLGGSLSMAAGAQFVFSLSGALTVNGASVTFGDFGIDDLVGLDSNVANGAYTLISGTAAINFSNVANLGAQNAVGISGGKQAYFSEGSLVVNVIPEPSTYALLGLGAVALGAHVLRRRRRV